MFIYELFKSQLFTISLAVLMTAISYGDYDDLKILHFTLRPTLIPAPCSAGNHMTKNEFKGSVTQLYFREK
jgi:hypothetical protein